MTDTNVDLVVLGGGSGGYAAAIRAAELGSSVVLIEKEKVGGTCLHWGCVPAKTLLHAAEVADEAREGLSIGVKTTFDGVDVPALLKYKDGIINRLYKGLTGLVKSRGITTVEGEGKFVGPNTVVVGGDRYIGKDVILATGSYSQDAAGPDDRGPGHHLHPGAEPGVDSGEGDRPRRRRHRRRVRLDLGILRHRGHHRRGAADPGPAGGPVGRQAAWSGRSASGRSPSRPASGSRASPRTTPA